MAFGPSRHRAWVVGQRALECSLGSRGRSLGGLLETVLRRLGGRFGASCGPLGGLLGACFGPLGPSWGPLGASWELLGASWESLGGAFGLFLDTHFGTLFRDPSGAPSRAHVGPEMG